MKKCSNLRLIKRSLLLCRRKSLGLCFLPSSNRKFSSVSLNQRKCSIWKEHQFCLTTLLLELWAWTILRTINTNSKYWYLLGRKVLRVEESTPNTWWAAQLKNWEKNGCLHYWLLRVMRAGLVSETACFTSINKKSCPSGTKK